MNRNRWFRTTSVCCAALLATVLLAGSTCNPEPEPTPVDSPTVLAATYTIAGGGLTPTSEFRLTAGQLYTIKVEGNSGTDPDVAVFTSGGTQVALYQDAGTIEFHEVSVAATGNYHLIIYNYGGTAMTATVTITRG